MLRHSIIVTLVTAGVVNPVATASDEPWNRKVEAVSVVPVAGGGHEIGAYVSVHAIPTTAPLVLHTELLVLINGVEHDIAFFEITTQAADGSPCGPCDFFDICSCGFDPHTGVFGCACGSFLTFFHTQATLQPGDEIMVLLRPAAGALPEQHDADDRLIRPFDGHPLFWDRRVASMRVVPSGPMNVAGDNFFDIIVDIDLGASYDGPLHLPAGMYLMINGATWDAPPVCPTGCGDTLVWNPCAPDGACPGLCAMNGDGVFVGECSGGCSEQFPPCNCCVPGWATATFVGVPASPGDELTVILRPAPGALPELPGFGDDEMTRPVPCIGDLDGNGFVDVDDLVTVLLDWECTDPPGPCPGDANLDGQVDVDDLILVLLRWGPCFPV